MAETFGSLCDKLTIVKLKQYHTEDEVRKQSLLLQESNLKEEIDEFLRNAFSGNIPMERLTFSSNKVFKKEGNEVAEIKGSIGEIFSKLSEVNCLLWHEQEKVYEFDQVPAEDKNKVVKQLAILNLQRNKCIDEIDNNLKYMVVSVDKK